MLLLLLLLNNVIDCSVELPNVLFVMMLFSIPLAFMMVVKFVMFWKLLMMMLSNPPVLFIAIPLPFPVMLNPAPSIVMSLAPMVKQVPSLVKFSVSVVSVVNVSPQASGATLSLLL